MILAAIYAGGFLIMAVLATLENSSSDDEPIPLIGIFVLSLFWPVIVLTNIVRFIRNADRR